MLNIIAGGITGLVRTREQYIEDNSKVRIWKAKWNRWQLSSQCKDWNWERRSNLKHWWSCHGEDFKTKGGELTLCAMQFNSLGTDQGELPKGI